MPSASAHAAALWAGLNIILLLVLSVLVTRQRRKYGVVFGDGGAPELTQAIRAFGNASEYIPAALVGLGILAFAGAPPRCLPDASIVDDTTSRAASANRVCCMGPNYSEGRC